MLEITHFNFAARIKARCSSDYVEVNTYDKKSSCDSLTKGNKEFVLEKTLLRNTWRKNTAF